MACSWRSWARCAGGDPFLAANAQHLRVIAWALLGLQVVSIVIGGVGLLRGAGSAGHALDPSMRTGVAGARPPRAPGQRFPRPGRYRADERPGGGTAETAGLKTAADTRAGGRPPRVTPTPRAGAGAARPGTAPAAAAAIASTSATAAGVSRVP